MSKAIEKVPCKQSGCVRSALWIAADGSLTWGIKHSGTNHWNTENLVDLIRSCRGRLDPNVRKKLIELLRE